ncbi:Ppx/GppA family phosphatase [Salinibacterium sp.]|uniref:Ppx/GppA phosphatase family protein n=1 Tax=Salinibacterium sp. TaxID=1915057 RepID=UPI00286A1244|nr:Ppx/GppA family phosphatase [Salinibacterium sp.]
MRLGVLDIGSNTVHLLVIDAHAGARPVPLTSHKRPLQLIEFLDDDGSISATGESKLIQFVAEATILAQQHGAEDVMAFATSALREAGNGRAVLARVFAETGTRLIELSGSDEAAVTFLAVRRWYGWGAGTILNLDIGGGSFELAMGADEQPELALSVPLGAGRLTRDFLDEDPPTAKSVKAVRKHIRATLDDSIADIQRLGSPTIVSATSKSFRSLARLTGSAPRADGPYVRRELRLHDVVLWASRLSAMASADRATLPGVSALRSRQLLAAALVAQTAMEGLHIESVQICPWALREGLILRRFDHLTTA